MSADGAHEEAGGGRTRDVVVVGGGISGLVAAWELRDHDVLLLEQQDRVGGRIESEPRGDYWLNLAAHLFPGEGSTLGRIVAEAGLETVPVRGSTMAAWANDSLVRSGPLASYPLRLRLPLAARVSLLDAGARIRRGTQTYRRLARRRVDETNAAVRRRLLAYLDDRSFAEFLGPLHPEADAILRAAIRRVAAEPEAISAGAGLAQFVATFSGSSSQFQRNLPGGSARLPARLARLLGDRVRKGVDVTRVTSTHAGVDIDYAAGVSERRIRARTAIVATPAPVARRIVASLPAATAAALDSIAYGPYVVAAILTREARAVPWDSLYALVAAGLSFNMLFNVASVRRTAGRRKPGGSVMVYGASELGKELLASSDQQIEARLLRDLGRVFPEMTSVVDDVIVRRWNPGIPSSRPGRHLHQAALERPIGNTHLVGDYIGERAGMDTAAQVAAEVAARTRTQLAECPPAGQERRGAS